MEASAKKMGRPAYRVEDPDLVEELGEVSETLRKWQGEVRELEAERNRLFRMALRRGWPQAQIAEVTGLDSSRVAQLVERMTN